MHESSCVFEIVLLSSFLYGKNDVENDTEKENINSKYCKRGTDYYDY